VQVFPENFVLFCKSATLFHPAPTKTKQLCFVSSSDLALYQDVCPFFFLFLLDITLLSESCVQIFHMYFFSLSVARLFLDSQSIFSKSPAVVHRLFAYTFCDLQCHHLESIIYFYKTSRFVI